MSEKRIPIVGGGNKYKNMETLLPEFSERLGRLVEDVFLKHLTIQYESIRLFIDFDEENIAMLLDVDYMMSIVLLNKTRTVKACYVYKALEEGLVPSKREIKSYRNYLKSAKDTANALSQSINKL